MLQPAFELSLILNMNLPVGSSLVLRATLLMPTSLIPMSNHIIPSNEIQNPLPTH